MKPEIRNVNGHYEAYLNGKFVCSGDTRSETKREAEQSLTERSQT